MKTSQMVAACLLLAMSRCWIFQTSAQLLLTRQLWLTLAKLRFLNLVAGAGIVNGSSDIITNIETKNGKQRIVTSMQADYSFGVKCKGYSWDTSVKSPTDAQIGTGSNWSQVVSNVKHTAGTMLIAKDA